MRKLSIIFITTFFSQNSLQLHLALLVIMVAFALHHSFLPFDLSTTDVTDADVADSDDADADNADDDEEGGGYLLHRLERNSLLALMFLLWSASVFYLDQTSCTAFGCNALSITVVVSNVIFLVLAVRLFIIQFLKRTKLVAKISDMVGKGGGVTNPMYGPSTHIKRASGVRARKGRVAEQSHVKLPQHAVMFSSNVRRSIEMSACAAKSLSSQETAEDVEPTGFPRDPVTANRVYENDNWGAESKKDEGWGESCKVYFDESSGRRYRTMESGNVAWIDMEAAEHLFFDEKTKRRYDLGGWVDGPWTM